MLVSTLQLLKGTSREASFFIQNLLLRGWMDGQITPQELFTDYLALSKASKSNVSTLDLISLNGKEDWAISQLDSGLSVLTEYREIAYRFIAHLVEVPEDEVNSIASGVFAKDVPPPDLNMKLLRIPEVLRLIVHQSDSSTELTSALSKLIKLEELFSPDPEVEYTIKFKSGTRGSRSIHYSTAWALYFSADVSNVTIKLPTLPRGG